MRHSFEEAVSTLGLEAAKPLSIFLLMNCEKEGAPDQQAIKSHLQKYRVAKCAPE